MDKTSTTGFLGRMTTQKQFPKVDLIGVGDRLRLVRESFELNSGDFARSIQVDPSSYSKIEKGEKPLKMEMGFKVAEIYGVTMDYLYRGRLVDIPEKVLAHHRQSLKNRPQ